MGSERHRHLPCRAGWCATWDEVEGDIWTIPASRMKGGREHRIPLPARARAILESLPKDGRYIFQRAGGQPLAAVAMHQGVLQRLRPNATVHGTARASFKTWAGERTSFPRETVEIALAHRIGNQTEQSYERGDKFEKRRRLDVRLGRLPRQARGRWQDRHSIAAFGCNGMMRVVIGRFAVNGPKYLFSFTNWGVIIWALKESFFGTGVKFFSKVF